MAQSVAQQTFGPYGAFYSSGGVTMSVTMGEPFINTYTSGAITLTQGQQQPASPGTPLPITLLSFTAKLIANNNQTQLDWVTGEEENNSRFDILKSDDGQHFTLYQSVSSRGDSHVKQSYTALDLSPYDRRTFYRLRQVDLDGQSSYSAVVSVERHVSGAFKVYPQPAKNGLFIAFESPVRQDLQWDLFDITGKLLQSKYAAAPEGASTLEWDIQSLAAGVYFIKCRNMPWPAFRVVKQ